MAISRKEAKQKFRGLCTPLMTPFKEDYQLDLDGLRRNVRYLRENGFGEHGSGSFLVAGAGGEFQVLTTEERKKVGQTVFEETRGRVPLIFGAQHTNPQKVIELCKFATSIGMEGVQLSPPYYDPGQSVDDIIRFFRLINDATDIGIMVYTTWWHGHKFPRQFFTRLLDLENVVGIKFSEPTIVEVSDILARFADKFAFVGMPTDQVTVIKLGGVGFISHEAHFHLEHQLHLWKAFETGDYTKAVGLLAQLNWPFYRFHLDMSGKTGITDANVTKAAVEMVGLAAGPVRPPARSLTTEERASLRHILTKAGAPVLQVPRAVRSKRP